MNAGIIAAGDGTRLSGAFPGQPKPLVPVADFPLIGWTVRGLTAAGIKKIVILLNSRGRKVREFLETEFKATEFIFLEADTASSWESFRLVAEALSEMGKEAFLISTVDCLLPQGMLKRMIAAERRTEALGVTSYIDDEKPLWADLDENGRISALGDAARQKKFATAGVYRLSPELARRMPAAAAYPNLRSYLAALIAEGVPVAGVDLGKTIDVDRPEDLRAAEEFLKLPEGTWKA